MPFIDESVFNEQMRGLLVARGGYTSEKKKEEIKRYWYLEFRSSDERVFIQVMGKLKFAGKAGEGFPSFRDFREQYNIIMPKTERLKGREYCGLCVNGTVLYREVISSGQVHDVAAGCSICEPNRESQVNPHGLFKDRLGTLRTAEAMAKDREKILIQRPAWLFERHPELKDEKFYFQGLRPQDDPDVEMEVILPPEMPKVPY